jgi:uncharacterized protein
MRSPNTAVESVPFSAVEIEDDFWSPRLETNRTVTIAYQYDQLHESGTLDNFRRTAAGESGKFNGMWFQDSDAYKWLEAASYVLATRDDPKLEAKVDEVIELVASAQWEDGYVNTYFSLLEPDNRWTNLHMMHELYCAGHLIEAAVAHYRATGKTSLLDVARNFADHIDDVFDEEVDGVPGHEEVELALIQLFRVTGTERYFDLAKYFIDLRGKDDRLAWEIANLDEIGGHEYDDGALFSSEDRQSLFLDTEGTYDGSYAQAHELLRKQETVEGHSVRAMYLFAAAADLAMETDEPALVDALERLWRNMTTKRMYVTGGIGPEERHEGFSTDYDLRNDAYAETCAAIGSIFWNQRMFELSGEPKYPDLIERTLYNGVLAGVSADGRKFFYENPLESGGDHHRKGWFTCACCPPNVARLLASLGGYLYARDDSALYVNQYVGSTASTTVGDADVKISQESSLPWEGNVQIQIETSKPASFSVFLRVPEWCDDVSAEVNGEAVDADHGAYLELDRTWEEDEIALSLGQRVERIVAHPSVEADAGRVALQRGPLVYCAEAVDNDSQIHQYTLPNTGDIEVNQRADLLDGITTLECEAHVPDLESWDGRLYTSAERTGIESDSLLAIPYYAWDNREPGAMRVWIRSNAGQWS